MCAERALSVLYMGSLYRLLLSSNSGTSDASAAWLLKHVLHSLHMWFSAVLDQSPAMPCGIKLGGKTVEDIHAL